MSPAPAAGGDGSAGAPPAAPPALAPPSTAWSPLTYPIFRALWIASVASNLGTWMQSVGSTWLMTSLTPSPLPVAMMQVATSLPVFLVGLPAGALADIIDRRRMLLFTQGWMLAAAALMGFLALTGQASLWSLLALTFALGLGGAMNSPVWQAITPELVPRGELPSALALSSVSFNIARAVGPALGGLLVAAAGPAAVFMLNAVSFVGVMVVIYRWRRLPQTSALPAERVLAAMRTGVRYVRFAPTLQRVFARTGIFIAGASALWALLPLVALKELGLGSLGYGVLLGCLGIGAVAGAFVLPVVRRRASADGLVVGATLLFALSTFVLGVIHNAFAVGAALLAGGAGWTMFTSSANLAAQAASPSWVRARALGTFLLVFQGSLAAGSVLWGVLAARLGEPAALTWAAAALAVGALGALRWPLSTPRILDLRPWGRAPALRLAVEPEYEEGPVLVTIEYQVDPARAGAFVQTMQAVGRVRRRTGAVRWGLYRDPENPRRFVETFLAESWGDHLRQRERVTLDDRQLVEQAHTFHEGETPPAASRLVYAHDGPVHRRYRDWSSRAV